MGEEKSYKAVDIKGVNAYWDEELLGGLQGNELIVRGCMNYKRIRVSIIVNLL